MHEGQGHDLEGLRHVLCLLRPYGTGSTGTAACHPPRQTIPALRSPCLLACLLTRCQGAIPFIVDLRPEVLRAGPVFPSPYVCAHTKTGKGASS